MMIESGDQTAFSSESSYIEEESKLSPNKKSGKKKNKPVILIVVFVFFLVLMMFSVLLLGKRGGNNKPGAKLTPSPIPTETVVATELDELMNIIKESDPEKKELAYPAVGHELNF